MYIEGLKTTINFRGDIRIDSYWKKWTQEDVFTCVKKAKNGLIVLIDPEGKECRLPKRNVEALKNIHGEAIF